MLRKIGYLAILVSVALGSSLLEAGQVKGVYLETRTCQVYTGPCFANAESGLAGRDAIMAWHIDRGSHQGVDISGLSLVMVVRASETHSGKAGQDIVRVDTRAIDMSLDLGTLEGNVVAGSEVKLSTRKARQGDCICSNEEAYYPPLAQVEHFVPGVTLEGEFRGRGLGTQWSTPDSRSAYMATFTYE